MYCKTIKNHCSRIGTRWEVGTSKSLKYLCKVTPDRVKTGFIIILLLIFACDTRADDAPEARSAGPKTTPAPKNPSPNEVDLAEDDLALLDLEVPVVFTAARREQKISSVPYAISVITREDIRQSGARSIPDALRLVPGIDVRELSFGSTAVGPRGSSGFVNPYALILVDGRQIYDSMFAGTLWGSWPFQLEDIDQIEVIRGPGGVTWGANAVNGVINIITRDPAEQAGVTITTGTGTRGWSKGHFSYAAKDDHFRFRISAEYEGSDGFDKGYSLFGDHRDDYHTGRATFHGIYEPDQDSTFTLSAGSALLHGGYSATPLVGVGLKSEPGSQSNYIQGHWKRRLTDDESFEITAYVNDFWADGGIKPFEYRYQQIALQFGHTFKLANEHTFTWGVDTRTDLLDSSNAHPQLLRQDFVSTAIIGLYAQDEWTFAPKWTLNMGARLDYEFYGGFQPSARLSLAYNVDEKSIIYGALSRSFHMYPIGIRYMQVPIVNGLTYISGRKNMEPHTVSAAEFGYRSTLWEKLDIGAVTYFQYHENDSTMSLDWGSERLFEFVHKNRGRATTYGLELDAKYRATKKLTLLGNYTLAFTDWDSCRPMYETELMSTPKNKFMLGARYNATEDLHLAAHLYYSDNVLATNTNIPFFPSTIDSYFRLDLRAEYEFWNDRASVSVGVRNLLDPDHPEATSELLTPAETPRMVFAELRFEIR